jgi:DNA polymerase-3 subunit alpha
MSLKISSFKYLGKKETYNLSMKSEQHNYILDANVVSANSHSVAYSFISYDTAWLKYYFPEEFYCALFNNTINEKDQLVKYIHSCRDHGIAIEPPDINKSAGLFTVDHGTIIFGLAGIKGVGEKACDHLLEIRPTEGFTTIKELIDGKVNAGTLKSLAASGSLSSMMNMEDWTVSSQALMESIPNLVKYYKQLETWETRKIRYEIREKEKKDAVAAGHKPPRSLPKLTPEPSMPVVEEFQSSQQSVRNLKSLRLSRERETLGFYITGHPLDDFPGLYEKSKWNIERIQENGVPGTSVKIPIVISSITKKRTKRGYDMGITILEDRTGRIEATIFPKAWKKIKDIIEVDKVALATCKIDRAALKEDEISLVKLILEDIEILSEEDKDFYGEPIITNIEIKLNDGTQVVFEVDNETKIDLWQKAKAIATNLEGTI